MNTKQISLNICRRRFAAGRMVLLLILFLSIFCFRAHGETANRENETAAEESQTATEETKTATEESQTKAEILPDSGAHSNRSVRIGAFLSSGYHHKNADGTLGGYGFEYEALLAQYAGWDVTYIEGNWSRLQEMLTEGEIDLLGFMVETPERKQIYSFADYPSGSSTSCLITAQNNSQYAYEDYTAFDGMRVAYQERNANLAIFKSWCERNQIRTFLIPCGSYEQVYQAIDNGSADAGLATSFYDLSDYKIIANIGSSDFFYGVAKENTDLFQELNQAVKDIHTYYPDIESSLYSRFYDSANGRGETFTTAELEYLRQSPVVTVFPAGRGAPFESVNRASGTVSGFVPDVLKKVSELTGIQFQYNTTEKLEDYVTRTGDRSVATSMTCDPTWAKQAGMKITQPFLNSTISMLTRSLTEEEVHTVGMQRENFLINHVTREHTNWEIQYYNTMEERLDAVFDGKCDAALMNSCEAEYYMASGKYNLLHEAVTSDVTQSIAFALPLESDPLLFSILSKTLLMIPSDAYDTMMRDEMNYGGKTDFSSLIYTNPVQVLLIAIIILLLAATILFLFFYVRSIHKKNLEILAATQVKTDFFSRMSHDMRTPMNGILGMTALSEGENDPAVLHHNLEQIESSGRYMLSLINDTLDLQKLEAGKMKLEFQTIYVADFFESLLEMMRPNAASKGVAFEACNLSVDLDKYVLLDPTRIKQIFVNILSNAIKFTPKGGKVRFTAECLGRDGDVEHDRFRVTDNGIGMSQEFIEKGMFHPYSQEDSSITSKYGGTGLGLAITKNIVDAMGGTISVESTPGEGTCFTVCLDFRVVSGEAETEASEAKGLQRKAGAEPDTEEGQGNAASQPAKTLADITAALNGKRILLCEDHPLNAEIAVRLLQKVGCEVVHAADGKLGVERFADSEVDFFQAILMDIRMPNMDGLTAAKAIRACGRPDAAKIPIIAMTANAFQEDIRQSKEAGMNAHLAKPIEPQLLYETLAELISSGKT